MKYLPENHNLELWADETPAGFAAQIEKLMKNPELAGELGRNARLLAEGELNWKNIILKVEEAYEFAGGSAHVP